MYGFGRLSATPSSFERWRGLNVEIIASGIPDHREWAWASAELFTYVGMTIRRPALVAAKAGHKAMSCARWSSVRKRRGGPPGCTWWLGRAQK